MKNRFFGGMILCMAIGFFSIFMAVHASIAEDYVSFLVLFASGCGAVSLGVGLNAYGRYIESMRRLEADTDEIRASYEDPGDVHPDADAVTDPETIYPRWQKCNRCGVYLWDHGVEDHPWIELDMEAEQRRKEYLDLARILSLGWNPGPGTIVEHDGWPNNGEYTGETYKGEDWRNDLDGLYPEPADVVTVWGDDKPVRQWSPEETREFQRREAINREKNRMKRAQPSCMDHGVWQTCVRCRCG
jgi:hypothetical protein